MRALVFGAEGMLGTALVRYLARMAIVVRGTTRSESGSAELIGGVDITDRDAVQRTFEEVRPEVAVNCAGIVKSECTPGCDPDRVVKVNAHAPRVIADVARGFGARFVHVSTDCVYSGRRGSYREDDPSDAEDLYGQSKAMGEIADRSDCLTIRTSFIGRDGRRRRGLLEWLLTQTGGVVPGYTRARWSGLSAPELSRAIGLAIITPDLTGLYNVVGPVVSKAELIEVLVKAFRIDCRVERTEEPVLDRTLDGSRFAAATGYVAPDWADMARELAHA